MNNVSFTGMLVLSGTYENLIKARESNNLPEMDTFMSAVLPITEKTKVDHLRYQDRFLYGKENVDEKLNDPGKREYFYGGRACREHGLQYIKNKDDNPIKDKITYVVYTDKDAEDLYKQCFKKVEDFTVPEELFGITKEEAKEMGIYRNEKYQAFLKKFNDCQKAFRNSIRYSLPQISKEYYWDTCINRHKDSEGKPCVDNKIPFWDISGDNVATINVDEPDAFVDSRKNKKAETENKWTAEKIEDESILPKHKKKKVGSPKGWQSKI